MTNNSWTLQSGRFLSFRVLVLLKERVAERK